MLNIKRKEDCCGCNACGDICPVQAITFTKEMGDFLYPKVDENKCVRCGKCVSVCPILHSDELKTRNSGYKMEAHAAISKRINIRFDSTSGGLFTELAEYVLDHGGVVFGAVWGESFTVMQIVSESKDDLPRLRSSKYAQSDARGFYSKVKAAIQSGRMALGCGTPCQMAALRMFLGKEYENLVIVDFICRGINSPLVLKKYVEMMESQYGKSVVAIKQKCKELGWHRLTTKFTFSDGTISYDPRETSLFMRGFLNANLFCRASCYECKFKGFPRLADITLADCWTAVSDLSEHFNNDLGTSLVLCNTRKGADYFKRIADKIDIAEIDFKKVLAGNKALTEPLPQPFMDQTTFFKHLEKDGFASSMSFLGTKKKTIRQAIIGILRVIKATLRHPSDIVSLIRYNGMRRIIMGQPLLRARGRVLIVKEKTSRMSINADTWIGQSIFKGKSILESRLLLEKRSEFISMGYSFGYGCDIELFDNAKLEIGHGGYSNIGLTIICGESIKIGQDVICGRHVTIRDTNGNHVINREGYKCTRPVVIGDHVWLCEKVTVMPGVTIGSGSVIAAGSVVTKDVPPNSLAAGVPARVIRSGVLWRR